MTGSYSYLCDGCIRKLIAITENQIKDLKNDIEWHYEDERSKLEPSWRWEQWEQELCELQSRVMRKEILISELKYIVDPK